MPLPVMPYGETGSTFVVLGRPEGSLALGKFACTLRFTVKEIDPSTGVLPAAELQDPGVTVLRGMPTNGLCCMTVGTTASKEPSGRPRKRLTTLLRPPGVYCCRTGEAEEQGYEDEYQLEDLMVCPMSHLVTSAAAPLVHQVACRSSCLVFASTSRPDWLCRTLLACMTLPPAGGSRGLCRADAGAQLPGRLGGAARGGRDGGRLRLGSGALQLPSRQHGTLLAGDPSLLPLPAASKSAVAVILTLPDHAIGGSVLHLQPNA